MVYVIQYEVMYFRDGHWILQSRYTSRDRDEALTEARRVERELGVPTKVVREFYDTKDNYAEENTIWISENAPDPDGRDRPAEKDRDADVPVSQRSRAYRAAILKRRQRKRAAKAAARQKRKKPVDTGPVYVSNVLFAAATALLVGLVGAMILTTVGVIAARRIALTAFETYLFVPQRTIAGTFLICFLLIAVPMLNRAIPRGFLDRIGANSKKQAAKAPQEAATAKKPEPAKASKDDQTDNAQNSIFDPAEKAVDGEDTSDVNDDDPFAAALLALDEMEEGATLDLDAYKLEQMALTRFANTLFDGLSSARIALDARTRVAVQVFLYQAALTLATTTDMPDPARRALAARTTRLVGKWMKGQGMPRETTRFATLGDEAMRSQMSGDNNWINSLTSALIEHDRRTAENAGASFLVMYRFSQRYAASSLSGEDPRAALIDRISDIQSVHNGQPANTGPTGALFTFSDARAAMDAAVVTMAGLTVRDDDTDGTDVRCSITLGTLQAGDVIGERKLIQRCRLFSDHGQPGQIVCEEGVVSRCPGAFALVDGAKRTTVWVERTASPALILVPVSADTETAFGTLDNPSDYPSRALH